MRVAIREQLAFLVLVLVLTALGIVAVPTWLFVKDFVIDVETQSLTLTASLKAARVTAEINLLQTNCETISSRILLQRALEEYYADGSSLDAFHNAKLDILSALDASDRTGLLQARLYPRSQTNVGIQGLLNVTAGEVIPNRTDEATSSTSQGSGSAPVIPPPGQTPSADGDSSTELRAEPNLLTELDLGYPPSLYPNMSYVDLRYNTTLPRTRPGFEIPAFAAEPVPGFTLNHIHDRLDSQGNGLLLGPLVVNETTALISVTVPVYSNYDELILGYLTIVAMASSLVDVRDSREGLGKSGVVLMVGPTSPSNHFAVVDLASNGTYEPDRARFADLPVHFLLPPNTPKDQRVRHEGRVYESGTADAPFLLKQYPAALDSLGNTNDAINNASAILKTRNEEGIKVSVGYARTQSVLSDWAIVVEKSRAESYGPISTLSTILLCTVFATAAVMFFLMFPIAHFSTRPIRRLKHATEKTVIPPGGYYDSDLDSLTSSEGTPGSPTFKKGFVTTIVRMMKGKTRRHLSQQDEARRNFRIPGKVNDRPHWITDELTELTGTFNNMSDELVKQVTHLDETVAERTAQLVLSKKAAEAANESKTLFVANLSHELKTPLSGILGLTSLCMDETDMKVIQGHLGSIWKSGDLLLHLLEDLLNFSRNQIGHQIQLESKEFRLDDLREQTLNLFGKQYREAGIALSVNFVGSDLIGPDSTAEQCAISSQLPAMGPGSLGRLEDMCLWGDPNRLLQVMINLVSNAWKFTPAGGKVAVRIKCLGEQQPSSVGPHRRQRAGSPSSFEGLATVDSGGSSSSVRSRVGDAPRLRVSTSAKSTISNDSGSRVNGSPINPATALSINPLEPKHAPHIIVREQSPAPPQPPANARLLHFEIEVEDTGCGIPEDLQTKVLEPFVQVDPNLNKEHGGTGLGLSICQQLVNLMDGSLALQSTPGVGTTFTIRFPLRVVRFRAPSTSSNDIKSSEDMSNAARLAPPNGSVSSASESKTASKLPQPRLIGLSQPYFVDKSTTSELSEDKLAALDKAKELKKGQDLHVLIAEDNEINVVVLRGLLKKVHVTDLTIAKDGQQAYDLAKAAFEQEKPFDFIFMDVQMPNVDGLQATQMIRNFGFEGPIVATTAFSTPENEGDCYSSGMDDFLSKPVKKAALLKCMSKFATIPEEPESPTEATKRNGSASRPSSKNKKAAPSAKSSKGKGSASHALPPDEKAALAKTETRCPQCTAGSASTADTTDTTDTVDKVDTAGTTPFSPVDQKPAMNGVAHSHHEHREPDA